jgi:hypothetical protein
MERAALVAAGLLVVAGESAHFQEDVAALVKKLNSTFDVAAGANGLAKLGIRAKSAVPELGKALKKARFEGERVAICKALDSIISASRAQLPNLRASLKATRNARERARLNREIQEIETASSVAVPDMAEAYEKIVKFKDEKNTLARALGNCGPAAGKAAKALATGLNTGFSDNQIAAAEALGKIGPAARDAIPALERASKTGFLDVRKAAAEALKKVQAK